VSFLSRKFFSFRKVAETAQRFSPGTNRAKRIGESGGGHFFSQVVRRYFAGPIRTGGRSTRNALSTDGVFWAYLRTLRIWPPGAFTDEKHSRTGEQSKRNQSELIANAQQV
jgi:hypothetical protein